MEMSEFQIKSSLNIQEENLISLGVKGLSLVVFY